MAAIPSKHSGPSQGADAASSVLTARDDENESTTEAPPLPPKGSARGRPRLHGAGRQANRALRSPVTYAHKLAVIDYYDAHERDINATVREFYAHLAPAAVASRKRQIYKWVKERAAIEAMCFKTSTAGHSRRREKGTATTLGVRGEQELVLWIQALQRAGPDAGVGIVSAQTVRAKALEIAAQHGVPKGSFQATWSWQQGFVKRHQDAIQRF